MFRKLRGNLKRRYTLVGSRRLPFYDGTSSAAEARAEADHDGQHVEPRAGVSRRSVGSRAVHKASNLLLLFCVSYCVLKMFLKCRR